MHSLRAALDPKSIAIIGASENPNKVGGRPLRFLSRFGFKGDIFPVNPSRSETQGLKTWAKVEDLPVAPEVAIVAVAGNAAFEAVDACAVAGVKVVVIMTGGLTETDPVHGKEKERRMVQTARAHGMRIIGPNSQGIANFGTGAIASFSTMFVEIEPCDGPIGIVSQSGAMSVVPYGLLRQRGLGIRHAHATGNDCDVTACELAAVVAEDVHLKLLLLYLEGLPDPHHIARMAAVAHERDLPIIAVKGGRTRAGQIAAMSHTGALASADRVIDAFFKQHGILRANDVGEMLAGVELYLNGWKPRGRRIVVISTSGATCVMAADAASASGLEMARFAPQTTAALRAALPPIANAVNPVDITGALLTDSTLFGRTLRVLAGEPNADAFLVGIPVSGAGYDVPLYARESADCIVATGKPLILASPQPRVAAEFRATGVPVFDIETHAVNALARFITHRELMQAAKARADDPGVAPSSDAPACRTGGHRKMLNEAESLALVSGAGVPVVPYKVCESLESAIAAFRALGGPVAVKGCSNKVAHKTELGIVKINVDSAEGVEQAWQEIRKSLMFHGLSPRGVLVARMVRGRREMMIGAHRDPVFGPVVAFGDGGKYVEVMPDVSILLPPFAACDVLSAMQTLRIAPLLSGARGEPALDADTFIRAVLAVQELMTGQPIDSLDINPFVLGSNGELSCAVDAVVFQDTQNLRLPAATTC